MNEPGMTGGRRLGFAAFGSASGAPNFAAHDRFSRESSFVKAGRTLSEYGTLPHLAAG